MSWIRPMSSTCAAAVVLVLGAAWTAHASESDARARWEAHQARVAATAASIGLNPSSAAVQFGDVRLFADSLGNQIVVGEVSYPYSGDFGEKLTFPRVRFTFYDGSGSVVGTAAAYAEGSAYERLGYRTNIHAPVLLGNGFFKLWTSLPADRIRNYTASADGVWIFSRPSLADVQLAVSSAAGSSTYTASISNRGVPMIYFVRTAVAGYVGDRISDVHYMTVHGSQFREPCTGTQTDTEVPPGQTVQLTGAFLGTVDSASRIAASFEEEGPQLYQFTMGYDGGRRVIELARACAYEAVPSASWIKIAAVEGSLIFIDVDPNASPAARTGTVNAGGYVITINQPGTTCTFDVSPTSFEFGGRGGSGTLRIVTQPGCVWRARLRAGMAVYPPTEGVGSGELRFVVFRSGLVKPDTWTILMGPQPVTIRQRPGIDNHDLDDDGQEDLLWQHATDGRVAVWLMNETTSTAGHVLDTPHPDPSWRIAGMGDLDSDGYADIVWQNVVDGRTGVWFMTRETLREGTLFTIPQVADTNWRITAVGDLDGEGGADLIWRHQGDGRLAVWFMDGATVLSAEMLSPDRVPDLNWEVVGVLDLYGGTFQQRDLLWWNHVTGQLAGWHMSGTTLVSGEVLATFPVGRVWQVGAALRSRTTGKLHLFLQSTYDGSLYRMTLSAFDELEFAEWYGPLPGPSWRLAGPR